MINTLAYFVAALVAKKKKYYIRFEKQLKVQNKIYEKIST